MSVKNSMKLMLGASLTLAAGFVCADVSQTFEANDADTVASDVTDANATWAGDGTVKTLGDSESTVSQLGGTPIEGSSTKYLAIAGEVTCTPTSPTATQTAQADFLVKIIEASDVLEPLEEGVKIAVAAGSEVIDNKLPVCIYCKSKADNPTVAWVTTDTKVTVGSWVRVTLTFDYAASRCRVAVDGLPVISANGYLSPDNNSDTNGAWYKLATDTTGDTAVQTVKFIGSTAIDDVIVAQKTEDAKNVEIAGVPETAKTTISGVEVSNANLVKWGVDATTAQTVKLDKSDLTVAEKVVCGLDPTDGTKFQLTKIAQGATTSEVKVRFPGTADGSRYTVSVYDNADGSGTALATATGAAIVNADGGGKEATVDLSKIAADKKVLFFKVKAATSGN